MTHMDQDFHLERAFEEILDTVNSMCKKLRIDDELLESEAKTESEDSSGEDS